MSGIESLLLRGEEGIHQEAEGMLRFDGEEGFDGGLGFGGPTGSGEEIGFDGECPKIAGIFGFDFFESCEGLLVTAFVDEFDDLDHLFGGIVAAEFEFLSASTGTEGIDIELGASHCESLFKRLVGRSGV